jgi:exosortase J
MSAFPDSLPSVPAARAKGLTSAQFAACATALAVLGLSVIWPAVAALWGLWTTDALKSIGMVIPLVSMVLILRVWKTLGWQQDGTWWGLLILLITLVVERVQERAVLIMVVSPHWSTPLPPPSLVLLAYGSGVVLLFGGVRLYRAALFPILLLWFANPIPHVFSLWVDLPLQRVSAHIARAFAMSLGQPLTPDNLRLMFTPSFGMFIAPGCNGIRGAMTMGFIALIAGYINRFRWFTNAWFVVAAVLLGYVFNLLRLCLLVVYYVIALHFPSLQSKGEGADYCIGMALFFLATLLLFAVIYRLRETHQLPGPIGLQSRGMHDGRSSLGYGRLVAMGAMVLAGWIGPAEAYATRLPAITVADAQARPFPQRLGQYALVRSWSETQLGGPVIYVWAQYAPVGGGTPIALGISPLLGWHDPLICHSIRGDNPLWHGQLTMATAGAPSTDFSSAFYSNGVSHYLEASTQCDGASCGEFATQRTHLGFIYSHPDPRSLLSDAPSRPIPVLLRAETVDLTEPADTARERLTRDMRAFLSSVSLEDLTRPYYR